MPVHRLGMLRVFDANVTTTVVRPDTRREISRRGSLRAHPMRRYAAAQRPTTLTAVGRSVVVPSPSWPYTLKPQHATEQSGASVQLENEFALSATGLVTL